MIQDKNKSIAIQLAKISILLAFIVGLLLSAIQVYFDYVEEEKALNDVITKALKVSERSATASVHTLSENLAMEVVVGLFEYDFVYEAKITDDLGETLAEKTRDKPRNSHTNWLTKSITSEHKTFSIYLYPPGLNITQPGKLSVIIDTDSVLSSFYSRALVILVSGLIRNLLLVLLLYYAFHLIITRPIVDLANECKKIKPGSEHNKNVSIPKGHENDELGQLAHSANTLINENELHIQELKQTETKFRNIVEGSLQGIYVHNDFMPLFANQRCAEIFGYANADEILELNSVLYAFYSSEEYSRIEQYNAELLLGLTAPSIYESLSLRKDGSPIWLENHVTVIDWQGQKAIQCVVIDVTERKQISEELSYQASHDTLTGLLNRRAFEQNLKRMLAEIKLSQTAHALCFMDLDQFKVVNDTCGHAAGDELLRQLASILQNTIRKRDTLARLGGDEFGVLMEECSIEDAERIAKSLKSVVQDFRFVWKKKSFKVGVSMGLVPITRLTTDITGILGKADAACYLAKENGRNRIHIYNAEDTDIAQRHGEMQWVSRINQALENNHFCLYAQAIEALNNSGTRHYEILLRLKEKNGDIIGPNVFLPAAERFDLMSNIDLWVIKTVFDLLKTELGHKLSTSFIAINLSGQSLNKPEILDYIVEQIMTTELKADRLCFEITETAAIANLSVAIKFISTLKVLGCRFALDDFGSGLSSFAYLKNLPVDYLKIDGMFVKDITSDPIDHAMVNSINEIGHIMGMKTIAEFVENEQIKEMLEIMGVNYVQGYGIHKPELLDDLIARL